ncbi:MULTISPECIES: ATP synthase F1 subunit delta [unclassified Adlercreutzia]|uniref:ATP synthase F1 subunit delta n=1 Tax=unclassified Adlercreutzia TaxID=2636013 RepID=UPI0013EA04BC|nr:MULTISPECIES: ATP synthase F1 subunit delta [unclassified Adlercreutzia]
MPTNRLVVKEEVAAYAAVMFDAANEAGGQDAVLEVRNQMEEIIHLMHSDMDLSGALSDTSYTPEQRNALARAVFAECNPAFVEVMAVMAERGDADLLKRVFAAFGDELDTKLNLCVVDVTTVVALDDNLRHIIIEKAEAELGKKAVLRERIDPSILGGIIMSVNGKRIDASVVSQLNNARHVLKETTDGGEC